MGEKTISVRIAERPYTLVIDEKHEALFFKAAETINKRMADYSGSYTYKDKQDLLAMVALEYTTNFLQDERELSRNGNSFSEKLEAIDILLTKYLAD